MWSWRVSQRASCVRGRDNDVRIVMVTDSRLGTDRDGRVATSDPAITGRGWTRGLKLDMRYVVRVDPRPGSADMPVDADVRPLPFYIGVSAFLRALPRTLRVLVGELRRADCVVTRVPGLIGLVTVVLAAMMRRPVAVEVVGDLEDSMPGSGSKRWVTAALGGAATRWAVRRARAVRYVTQETLQRAYPASPDAVTVAFSSVQPGLWFEQASEPADLQPRVIAVGSQEQLYKGHDLLIRAWPEVRRSVPGAVLVLAGAGRQQALLRDMASSLGVDSAVLFLGQVTDKATLIREVDRAWVYAMPSRAEGLPRALVEAMARGRACVATRVGGIPELVGDMQLVDVDDLGGLTDRLVKLLSDGELRASLGRRNRDSLRPYMPDFLAAKSDEWSVAVSRMCAR